MTSKARSTSAHIEIDVSTVLAELWRDEVLPENVAQALELENAPVDGRDRAVLTDEELEPFNGLPRRAPGAP